MTSARIDLDNLDLFTDGDPFAAWRWLRRHQPVYWNERADGDGFWAVTKYDDVTAVYLDPVTFSSARGTVMGGSYRNPADSASGRMLICSDPPRHRLLRQQVQQGFSQRLQDRVEASVRSFAVLAIERMVADGGCDFAEGVAPWLPAGVLAGMMGLSTADAHHVMALTRSVIGHRDSRYQRDRSEAVTLAMSQAEILEFFMALVERRRREPGDDVVSLMLRPQVGGRPLRESEVLYNCLNLAVGGNETTPFTVCGGLTALIEHPEEAARLEANPWLLPAAVEEILRWTSTNAYVQRVATCEAVLRGQRIEPGHVVTVWNPSANRDEDVFPEPERFDVSREPNRHIAFGAGHHHCIGSTTARHEVAILFDELVRRGLRFRLAGPVRRLRSNFMLGLTSLPVEVV